jgi:myo-inositol-1(or 4)-monophosphatase
MLMEKKLADSQHWRVPWPPSMTAETRASAAYRMALVATGEFDATVSLTQKSDWDLAAGDLIVHEAGGLVTDRDGGALTYNRAQPVHQSVVCAGPALHHLLLLRLRDYIHG